MKAKIWQEMKSLSMAELDARLRDEQEKYFRLKFRHASTPLKNPMEIRNVRRLIARLKALKKNAEAKA